MALQVIPNGGATAAADSVSIPLTDLSSFGLTSGEMTANELGVQTSLFSALSAIQAEDLSSVIGLSQPANPTFTATGFNVVTYTFSFTGVYYTKQGGANFGMIPLPSSGVNNGLGGIALTDIFPNAAKVASAANVASEALLIPTADLLAYGSPAHASLNVSNDSRAWLAAFYQYLSNNMTVRATGVSSAITARSQGNNAIFTPPAAFTASVNPISGIAASDLPLSALISRTYSLTFQRSISVSNDSGISVNYIPN